jgi:hypothetical protein
LRIACFFLAEIEFFLEETALFELGRRRAAGGKLVKAGEPASSSANTPSMRIGMSCGAAANQLASLKKWQNGGHLPRIGGRRVHRSVDAVAAGGKSFDQLTGDWCGAPQTSSCAMTSSSQVRSIGGGPLHHPARLAAPAGQSCLL